MKLILKQQYMLYVWHSQYHVCWCSVDFRSQGINRHGIYPQSQNMLSSASEELMQKRRKPIANTLTLSLFCIKPSML